jgi:hypothetical protein
MIKAISLAALMAVSLAPGAFAQKKDEPARVAMSATECQSVFDEADTNSDGLLSAREIAAADLGDDDDQESIGRSDFIAVCVAGRG